MLKVYPEVIDFLKQMHVNFKLVSSTNKNVNAQNVRVVIFKVLGFPIRYILGVMPLDSKINYSKLSKLLGVIVPLLPCNTSD